MADLLVIPGGVGLIAAERERQISQEGWSAEHDDLHAEGILAIAAAELAVDGYANITPPFERDHCGSRAKYGYRGSKPDRVRALTIAGALIAAEIDRLQRVATPEGTGGNEP
jgi:hypothetical protein